VAYSERMRTIIATTSVAMLALAGCAADGDSAAEADLTVVATTTVWGSIVGQVVECAGEGEALTLMPVGADPHDYAPSAKDVATMVNATVVFANGLGLEEGLAPALDSAAQDGATIVELAPSLQPIPFSQADADDDHSGDDHADDDHSGDDPHVWLDMSRAATAATIIGEDLAAQTSNDAFAACGQEVAEDIRTAEEELLQTLAAVPQEQRILVTDHDALGYFAEAYDFEIAGVVVPGGSTLAEPSSAELAALTETIEETGVTAVFSNVAVSSDAVDAVAAEVGEIAVVPLFVGSVGEPGTPAEDYQGMMLFNADAIAEALA